MSKTTQLSVRLSTEDAEFIEAFEHPGAHSSSDKLRVLIQQARLRQASGQDYEAAVTLLRELLEPVSQAIRSREHQSRQRSEIIADTLYWLPDLVAYLIAGPHAVGPQAMGAQRETTREGQAMDLLEFESGLVQRIYRFVEAALRLAVTERAPCYDPTVIDQHLAGALDLSRLVLERADKQRKG